MKLEGDLKTHQLQPRSVASVVAVQTIDDFGS
jgi:hypothetical protein